MRIRVIAKHRLCRLIVLFDQEAIQNGCTNPKLFVQFYLPLLSQGSRKGNENALSTGLDHIFEHKTSFNCFTKTDFVGKNNSSGFQRLQSCTERIDLMRIQLNIRIEQTTIRRFFKCRFFVPGILLQKQVGHFRSVPPP